MQVNNGQGHLMRDNLYSRELKDLLLDDLFAMKFVKVLTEFPDGTTFNIPSLGEASTNTFVGLDTGNLRQAERAA